MSNLSPGQRVIIYQPELNDPPRSGVFVGDHDRSPRLCVVRLDDGTENLVVFRRYVIAEDSRRASISKGEIIGVPESTYYAADDMRLWSDGGPFAYADSPDAALAHLEAYVREMLLDVQILRWECQNGKRAPK